MPGPSGSKTVKQRKQTFSTANRMQSPHHNSARLLACALAFVAFQVSLLPAMGLQQADHEQGSPSQAAALAPAGSESAGAGVMVDSSSALASPDDLLAAESSQSPEAEHKAFTSAQMSRQEQASVSIAPGVYMPQQANIYHHQQQQQQPPVHMQHAAPRYPPQGLPQHQQLHHPSPHHSAHPKHMNPFMAAALAGNYGQAQQQMAAAALHAQQALHMQQQQQQQAHQHIPAGPPAHVALHPQQQPPQHHVQMQPPQIPIQAQQQVAPAPHVHGPQLAVQESNIRHNVVPAPAVESNTIDLSEQASALPAGSSQQQQQQQHQSSQTTQLATAASAQHPVIAAASTAVASQHEAWPLQAPDIPKIVNLEVKCEKNLMKVSVEFDKIFNGVIFSKGHFSQGQCVHVGPNSNKQQAYFDISINSCGTQGNTQNGLYGMGQNTGSGTFFENTIVIQYDPNVQEVYDHARKLRCTWHDQYEKAVTFRPFPVDMLDIVRADFAGDNVGCWMQIQVGKGPWASEVAGIVKIGQTMTMVLAIKDEENKFDMLVRNCFAHDGKRGPIELVDKSGCITRPKLMSRFTKIKNFGSSATVLSYAHFQAFKFPDSMEVHFQCTIQICRHQCPEQCSQGNLLGGASHSSSNSNSEAYSESTISGTFNIGSHSNASPDSTHLRKFGAPALSRERRSLETSRWSNGSHHHSHNSLKQLTKNVGLNRVIQVVSTGDLAFAVRDGAGLKEALVASSLSEEQPAASSLALGQQICMSSFSFVLALVLLALILLCSCLAAIALYVRQRSLISARGSSEKQLLQSSQTPSPSPPVQNQFNSQYIHANNVPTQSKQQHFYIPERR